MSQETAKKYYAFGSAVQEGVLFNDTEFNGKTIVAFRRITDTMYGFTLNVDVTTSEKDANGHSVVAEKRSLQFTISVKNGASEIAQLKDKLFGGDKKVFVRVSYAPEFYKDKEGKYVTSLKALNIELKDVENNGILDKAIERLTSQKTYLENRRKEMEKNGIVKPVKKEEPVVQENKSNDYDEDLPF